MPISNSLGNRLASQLGNSMAGARGLYDQLSALFGATLLEAWDSELGIALASGAVDTWTGQKRGVVLSAAAAGNRPAYGADGSSFRGRNVVQCAVSGAKYLRNTAIAPDLIAAVAAPYTLTICRQRTALNNNTIFTYGSTASQFELYAFSGTGNVDGAGCRAASADRQQLSADAYTANVKMLEIWCAGTGLNIRHNVGTAATNAAGTATTGALNRLTIGAGFAGATPNDLSVRSHLLLSTKPSDAVLSQALAIAQADSGF